MRCSECGRLISRHLRGVCMACRYRKIGRTARSANRKNAIKIAPDRLVKPILPPTYPVKIGEVVPINQVAGLLLTMQDSGCFNGKKRTKEERSRTAKEQNKERKNAWTPERDAELISMRKEGKAYADIATITGRSLCAIEQRLVRLRKEGKY